MANRAPCNACTQLPARSTSRERRGCCGPCNSARLQGTWARRRETQRLIAWWGALGEHLGSFCGGQQAQHLPTRALSSPQAVCGHQSPDRVSE